MRLLVAGLSGLLLALVVPGRARADEDDEEGCATLKACHEGCEKGAGADCFEEATFYSGEGEETPPDPRKALALFEKACEMGERDGCVEAGNLYRQADLESDRVRAAVLFAKACEAGADHGCSLLAPLLWEGRGVTRDRERAVVLFRRSCDKQEGAACTALGGLYEKGLTVPRDAGRALELYKHACAFGDDDGCSAATRLNPPGKKKPKAQ